MPFENEGSGPTLNDFVKAKALLEKLRLSKVNHDSDYRQDELQTDFKESELREVFHGLGPDEKMLILYEAILANAVGIADSDRKLDFFRKTEKIGIKTWFKKVMIASFAFMGVVAFSTFVFMIVKNGALNDMSVVASFFKTVNEVVNVIFLTK